MSNGSAEFDPAKFEDKYVHYFEELEAAYSNAYQQLHGKYDSTVLKAIDRQVLAESEPFYEGDGEFRVELPDDVEDRVGSVADHEQFEAVLEELVDRIERELQQIFGFEATE
ncbi:DUF5783 family protein [Halopiger xanaduensis]|uniref:Uncharacterized protein n=1 Tax=Halopiger xanaduensis (strain DSM 18323 / JCM 14033 / SH-6) TaxID=797210 RepID=F8D6P2_HALXS|nr:DUF5783 family protein [Halopiger xanaduensis]AEH37782.1 hypothetical protein Halxa_3169 [Halopiger xanaduensis SH-6]